jgi:hypothetical protein
MFKKEDGDEEEDEAERREGKKSKKRCECIIIGEECSTKHETRY